MRHRLRGKTCISPSGVIPGLESGNVVHCLFDYFNFSTERTVIIIYLHEFHTLCVTHLCIVGYAGGLLQSRILRRKSVTKCEIKSLCSMAVINRNNFVTSFSCAVGMFLISVGKWLGYVFVMFMLCHLVLLFVTLGRI
jgi:hypothetical protein